VLEEIMDEYPAIDKFDVIVPVFKDKGCVAFFGLGEKIYGVPYHHDELAHLSVLATQVGSALQNIRLLEENVERKLFEEELKIARKIQSQLLPGEPPDLTGFQLCGMTVPSRYVGGDYYDFVVIDDKWLVIAVADVSGKGIPASILTATLQAAVRSNIDAQTNPCVMVSRLNKLLYQNTSAAEFATLFYGVINLDDGRLKYTNAGHDFPFMINGAGVESLSESGIVLGCLEEFTYQESACTMPENGALVIYTDGVTDAETSAGDYFGENRLKSTLERCSGGNASEICKAIVDDARQFGSGENRDDITVVVLKRAGSPGPIVDPAGKRQK
jgi:sigma-B regulation protein RsbU (phosphoserine phosphatase)